MKIDINNNDILFKSYHNPKDGLYNIPVFKTKLQHNNYIPPKSYALMSSMYYSRAQKTPSTITNTSHSLKNKKLSYSPYHIEHVSDCDYNHIISPIIQKQQTSLKSVSLVHPSINIIIRKDRTKRDLVKFLHGACCSPAPPSWIKAIVNNHFVSWPDLT